MCTVNVYEYQKDKLKLKLKCVEKNKTKRQSFDAACPFPVFSLSVSFFLDILGRDEEELNKQG